MKKLKPSGLACFSPPVMLATFIIEIIAAAYTLWRYKLNSLSRLIVAILLFLATFQLAEYNVCQGAFGIDALTWSRIGYVAITMLPPLGIHVAYELANSSKRPILPWAYGAAGIFVIFFALIAHSLTGQTCLGNYVIFDQAPGSEWLYGLYYYGLLATGIILAWHLARGQKTHVKQSLLGLIIGYTAFLLPTITLNLVDKQIAAGIPSIMCGFAVLFALLLIIWILPKSGVVKKR